MGYSMVAEAIRMDKGFPLDSRGSMIGTTRNVAELRGLGLRCRLLASYRVPSMIASFEERWNLLK
jgi:hypothetical protein